MEIRLLEQCSEEATAQGPTSVNGHCDGSVAFPSPGLMAAAGAEVLPALPREGPAEV